MPGNQYDTIVIGAGSAGCVVAARLSEDPNHSVLLLEAGPDYPDLNAYPDDLKFGNSTAASQPGAPHNWSFLAPAHPAQNQQMHVARGKVVGGTSAINGQIILRGVPEDYDSWAESGNDQWNYQKMLPYLKKLETDADFQGEFHGASGPIPVHRFSPQEWDPFQQAFYQAAGDAGYPETPDMNHPDSGGVSPIPLNSVNGVRISAGLAYVNPARHRLNLTVRPNALVRRILFRNLRAAGVEVESGGELFHAAAEQIVLCAGAIATPQLLMLSGIGPAEHLKKMNIPVIQDQTGVGRNLRDHPAIPLFRRVKPGFSLDPNAPPNQVGLRYTAAGSSRRNDMQIFPKSFVRLGPMLAGVELNCIIQLAESRGRITLSSADPHAQPRLEFGFLEHPNDRARLREALQICFKLLQHPAFQQIIDPQHRQPYRDQDISAFVKMNNQPAQDRWLDRNVRTWQHLAGTAKMGPDSDSTAVVDQYCRVKGVDGLRIADASVMPNVVRANTNATAMAIGERVADFIKTG